VCEIDLFDNGKPSVAAGLLALHRLRTVAKRHVVDQPAEKHVEAKERKQPEEELLLKVIHVAHPLLILNLFFKLYN
jgi:hypothetical protein